MTVRVIVSGRVRSFKPQPCRQPNGEWIIAGELEIEHNIEDPTFIVPIIPGAKTYPYMLLERFEAGLDIVGEGNRNLMRARLHPSADGFTLEIQEAMDSGKMRTLRVMRFNADNLHRKTQRNRKRGG